MPPAAPTPRRTPAPVMFAVGLFFAVLGGALLFAAGKIYLKQRAFLARSEHAEGTVVDFQQSVVTNSRSPYERHNFYAPVFTFTDRSGQSRRVTSKTSDADKPGYRVGQTVPVLYDRDRPDEAELDTFFASWSGPTILGGMGLVLAAFGGGVVAVGLRRLKQRGATGAGPRDPAILSGR